MSAVEAEIAAWEIQTEPRMPRVAGEKAKQVLAAANVSGATTGGIARQVGVSNGYVSHILNRHGVDIVSDRPKDGGHGGFRKPAFRQTNPLTEKILAAAQEPGATPSRVRGLTGEAAIAADKLWQRELKRREKTRVKRVSGLVRVLHQLIDFISKEAPEAKLPEALARFAVGGHDTLVATRELIADAMLPLSEADADAMMEAVRQVYLPISKAVHDRQLIEWKRQREKRAAEETELAALAAPFPLPPPPPPLEPFPAEVRKETKSHRGRVYRAVFEVEGSLADVERTIEMATKRWFDGPNPVHFKPPEQIAEDRWIAHGHKDLGTD